MAEGESYLSRFFVKFVEISAAGVATAVSGYVLAHFSGYLNGPQPAVPQPPAAVQMPAALPVPAGSAALAPATVPPAAAARTQAAAPAPASASASVSPPAAAPAKTAVTTSPAAPLRKSLASDKPAETANAASTSDGKIRDVTDTKPRSAESIEAEVRAALAKVDATHPVKADAKIENKIDNKADIKIDTKTEAKQEPAPRRADNPPELAARTPPAETKPRAVDAPTGTIAAAPRAEAPSRPQLAPQPVAQPLPQAPLQIAPPPAVVEIKSAPIVGTDSAAQTAPQADAQARADDGGLFSVFRRLPEKLRDDKPLPTDQAPRPPADVGQ